MRTFADSFQQLLNSCFSNAWAFGPASVAFGAGIIKKAGASMRVSAFALLALLTGARAWGLGAPTPRPAAMRAEAFMMSGPEAVRGVCRDTLMKKSVDTQLNAFALINDVPSRTWLTESWQTFYESSSEGYAHARPCAPHVAANFPVW